MSRNRNRNDQVEAGQLEAEQNLTPLEAQATEETPAQPAAPEATPAKKKSGKTSFGAILEEVNRKRKERIKKLRDGKGE